jgi:4-amino-4-deoxy-L-arabinose transferase-like glycosyltransferase
MNIYLNKQDVVEKYFWIFFVGILLIAAINLFNDLSTEYIQDWDEARYGVNAYEMIKNHNYIKITYQGATDYYTTKPPLGLWLIALAFKTFGFGILGLRLISALSALACIMIIIIFIMQLYNKKVALLSGFILATTYAFIFRHSARTGDFDSLLSLFVLLSFIFAFYADKNIKYFYLSGLTLALGFLVKSFAMVIAIAVIILYILFSKKYQKIRLINYIIFLSIFCIPILTWGCLRYTQDGFIFFQRMISYDLLNRVSTAIEGHREGAFYYFRQAIVYTLPWSFLFAVFILIKTKKEYCIFQAKNLLLILWVACPLAIYTIVQTKLYWYINPIYPALAALIAIKMCGIIDGDGFKGRLGIALFIILSMVGVAGNIYRTSYYNYHRIKNQAILLDLNRNKYQSNCNIYMMHEPLQSEIFILEVMKDLVPRKIKNLNEFIEISKAGELLMIDKNCINYKILDESKYEIISKNEEWHIIKKYQD